MSTMGRMVEHEEAMGGEGVNATIVLGRELLLVEVGGGAETHLAEAAGDGPARPAVDAERFDAESPWFIETAVHYDEAALVAPRWEATTLCGRTWHEMAAGEGGTLYLWQEASFAPTCLSCLRVVDTWFPRTDAPAGVELLAAVIPEGV